MQKPDESAPADDRSLLEEIRERRDDAFDADQDNANASKSDLQFLAGDQWPGRRESRGRAQEQRAITHSYSSPSSPIVDLMWKSLRLEPRRFR